MKPVTYSFQLEVDIERPLGWWHICKLEKSTAPCFSNLQICHISSGFAYDHHESTWCDLQEKFAPRREPDLRHGANVWQTLWHFHDTLLMHCMHILGAPNWAGLSLLMVAMKFNIMLMVAMKFNIVLNDLMLFYTILIKRVHYIVNFMINICYTTCCIVVSNFQMYSSLTIFRDRFASQPRGCILKLGVATWWATSNFATWSCNLTQVASHLKMISTWSLVKGTY